MIFFLQLLFKKGGYNLFSHIDLKNSRGEIKYEEKNVNCASRNFIT